MIERVLKNIVESMEQEDFCEIVKDALDCRIRIIESDVDKWDTTRVIDAQNKVFWLKEAKSALENLERL